ncbi:MAG TPA: IS21 family transposase [Actinomycetota bacterium]|nr:IS21 family transposase [Actinomycetota bacterium]
MMTEEEYMDVVALARQGWKITEIAQAVGHHPATVSNWLKNGGPPPKRQTDPALLVVNEYWASRITEILKANSNLLGTSVERLLRAEGFDGSYPTLVRHLRETRGVRRHRDAAVSVPIETAAGEEFQFDWSDCCEWGRAWGLGELHCFGAILCWSRHRHWWFAPSVDRPHTFEGLVRFFEDAGGVAGIGRTDRMGALGVTRGKTFRFVPEALQFAAAHGFGFKACATGDAKRKGKIERPFRELKSSLMEELVAVGPPRSIAELNTRAAAWLAAEIHTRPHRVTGIPPALRLEAERPLLAPLPRIRYDTARVEPRRVGAPVPLVEVDAVSYSVPPSLVGATVEVRLPVDAGRLEVRALGSVVATHALAPPGSPPVWDPAHRKAAEAMALAPHARPRLRVVTGGESQPQALLELGDGDYEVEVPNLAWYGLGDGACGCGSFR